MAKNICLDCIYWLNCKKASEEIRECNEYKFIMREIERKEEKKDG